MRVNADGTSLFEHYRLEITQLHLFFKCRHCERLLTFNRRVESIDAVADSLVGHWMTHREEDEPLAVKEP
jgi:hypothetical protein